MTSDTPANELNEPSRLTPLQMSPLLFIVIVAGTAVLITEVIAPRLLVSAVGDPWSLAAISICSVLLAMAAGAFLAGYAKNPKLFITVSLGVSAVWLALIPFLAAFFSPLIEGSLIKGAWVLFLLVFPPSLCLGAVTPSAVRILLSLGAPVGPTIGAASALASIAGVFGAMLAILAPLQMPLSGILRWTAVALLLSILFLIPRTKKLIGTSVLLVVALFLWILPTQSQVCNVPSRQNCMDVTYDDGETVLLINGASHTGFGSEGLADPIFDYIIWMREIIKTWEGNDSSPLKVTHIGGGGGNLAAVISTDYPQSTQNILEIDPDVIRVSVDRFGLLEYPGISIKEVDGRVGIADIPTDSQDIVILDAFHGTYAVPSHLTTAEYATELSRILKNDGIIIGNIIESDKHGLSSAIAKSYAFSFPRSRLWISADENNSVEGTRNVILLLGKEDTHFPSLSYAPEGTTVLDESVWKKYIDTAPFLTDDFAPTLTLSGVFRI